MSKKRNRQPDVNGESSEESTESCDDSSTDGKCLHVAKAVNLSKIKKNIKKTGIPTTCPHCNKNEPDSTKCDNELQEQDAQSELWICLQCGNYACGRERNGHAIEHYKKPYSDCHFMVVDTLKWSVWCYRCKMEINDGCRKKLQETVEFIKRSTAESRNFPEFRTPANNLMRSQQERIVIEKEKDDLCNLTKTALSGQNLLPSQQEQMNMAKEKDESCKFPKIAGLVNLGNTCFFNAVLQCLVQTPFLVKVLNDLRDPGETFTLPGGTFKAANSTEEVELPPIEGTLERWGSFTSVLCKTLTEMQNSNGRQIYNPSELLNCFKKKTMQCMDGGQHDSHELLRHLLELVRNEDLRRYQSIILKNVGLNEKTNPDGVEKSLKSRIKFYGNQASARLLGPELVFRGLLVSTLECLDCHHTSESTEPFLDLSLPVMGDKPQPPVLKRKSTGCEDTCDITGNNISHVPSKYQLNKKEKRAARRNRWNRRQQSASNCKDPTENRSNMVEESNGSIAESEESDADIEDNLETEGFPAEVGESGYSSEKQSTLASPESPLTHQLNIDETVNGLTLNDDLPVIVNSPDKVLPDQLEDHHDDDSGGSPERQKYMQRRKSVGKTKTDQSSNHVCNDYNGITSGISRIGISGNAHQSPTGYATTKDGDCSIESCLNQFTALELMSGSNKVGCEVCTAKERKIKENCKMVCTPRTKRYLISQVPAVLILHLKRFQAQRIDFRKVTKHVSFPVLLDLAPISNSHKHSRIYSLYGVVEHRGTMHGGHYVAYVKTRHPLKPDDPRWSFLPTKNANNVEECLECSDTESEEAIATPQSVVEPPPGQWYYVSDSRVTEVDETTVLQSQAYLLFYERIL